MTYEKDQAKEHWTACQDGTDYTDGIEDWKFLHGIGQWDEHAQSQRQAEHRPCLTLNQLLPYALQVTNDVRQARLAIRVSPVDEDADIDTAEVFQGIIRNIERQSSATNAYTSAAMNAIGAGIGWLRIRTDYADPNSFEQEIYIDRVVDFTAVYLDPQSEEIDGSDAEYGFIRVDYSKERFEELYPDRSPVSWDETSTDDEVCVVEYFCKKYEKTKIYKIRLVDGSEQIITSEQKSLIDEDGTVEYEELDSRDTEFPYVTHYILNGEDEPLSEEEFPSQFIPLVPVIGEEVYIDNKREFHSLIRQGKDAQRMYNYWKSMSTEFYALQPKVPYVGAVGSFESDPNWTTINSQNHAYVQYDVVHDENQQRVEAPQRSAPVQGSAAAMQEAMQARDDIRLAIGMPNANMGQQGNEVSGIAIRNRQIEGDNATFHFIDNLSSSISYLGRIIVDMIPRLYSERKITRILGEDGAEKNVPVNVPFVKEDGQERPLKANEQQYDGIYQLGVGKYDVVCDVGASYSSKRQETADKLIEIVQAQPELISVVGDLIFDALDLPMGHEIADRLKATMNPAILGEDPQAERLKEAGLMVEKLQEQITTYEAALKSKKDDVEHDKAIDWGKLELEKNKIEIDRQKVEAEIEKMRAETTGFNIEAVSALGEAVTGINTQVQDIGQALEIMLDAKEAEANEAGDVPETSISEPIKESEQ